MSISTGPGLPERAIVKACRSAGDDEIGPVDAHRPFGDRPEQLLLRDLLAGAAVRGGGGAAPARMTIGSAPT